MTLPMHTGQNGLHYQNGFPKPLFSWDGPAAAIVYDEADIQALLLDLERTHYVVKNGDRLGLAEGGDLAAAEVLEDGQIECLMPVPVVRPGQLGDPVFMAFHGVDYPLYTGSMANGIASEEMVIALGRANILGSFGAAGLPPARLEAAICRIQEALPQGPYGFCLIHSPNEPALEQAAVDLYLNYGVRTVEASAFLDLTPHIVAYRAAGLSLDAQGCIQIQNRVIAKVSRREVAAKFLQPAPQRLLKELIAQNRISEQQAKFAEKVPLADDITVEADSGGHTDNRPLLCLLPSIQTLRDEIQAKTGYRTRVGAAGGIGTPVAALGAFMMGADYVVTGSINQACIEAGTSMHTKEILAQADMADVMMAPAADMFEMGVKLQVLKRGTLFPMRAQKLYDVYKTYETIEDIPADERAKLEEQIFRQSLADVWQQTVAFFSERDPDQIRRAEQNPRRKMALVFRWYLGLASHWANTGDGGREMDYQIWCGPAMGAFNDWTRGSYLAQLENRKVVEVNQHIVRGALYLYRLQILQSQGLHIPAHFAAYRPVPFIRSPR